MISVFASMALKAYWHILGDLEFLFNCDILFSSNLNESRKTKFEDDLCLFENSETFQNWEKIQKMQNLTFLKKMHLKW